MVSEACQVYMQHVDAAATHSGSVEDALSLLQAAQDILEKQDESGRHLEGHLEQRIMGAAQRLHAALTELVHSLQTDPDTTIRTAVAGVMSCPAGKALDDAATQQLLARERALGMLCSAVEKARQGGHQYLSGTLHNVAKALANAQPQPGAHKAVLAAGYGSRLNLSSSSQQESASGADAAEGIQPRSPQQRPPNYLSAMLTYIAQVGDAVAEADAAPSEAQNYFAMLQETPATLLPRLVAQWGCSDSTAERVAGLLGSDLVYEVLRAVLHPVHMRNLARGDGQHCLGATPESMACSCSTCRSCLPRAEGLPGLACRVPLPESGVSASKVTDDARLPKGSHPQEQEDEGADTVEAVADSAILPILGSVGSPGAKISVQSLLCPVLKELHAIAPLRASMAAAVALLQQAEASTEGPVPLIPSESTSRGGGAVVVQECDRNQDEEYMSTDSEQPETGGNAANGIQDTKEEGAKAEELLLLALQGSEQLDPIRQWLKLLLQESPKLSSMQAIAVDHGEMAAMPARDHRRTAKKLVEAGRWLQAVQVAQETGALDDKLLLRAIDGLADQAESNEEFGGAPELVWELCRRVKDSVAAGEAIMRHLNIWDLSRAQGLLKWAMSQLPQEHPLQKEAQAALLCLTFCQAVLDDSEASSEFKSWQGIWQLLHDDAALLGRRLLTCGAHAAAKQLCLIQEVPTQYIVEAHVAYMSAILEGDDPASSLLEVIRCLHALPAKLANEIALQLASIPALAAGSSQSMLLTYLQERETSLSIKQQSTLEAIRLSLHLPQPWRDRLSHLLGQPSLMLESLIMQQQFDAAREILKQAPSLCSDDLLKHYAWKAVDCNSEVSSSQPHDGAPQMPALIDLAPNVLSGDAETDAGIRQRFHYLIAPSARLLTSILSLSSSDIAAAESALHVADEVAQQQLTVSLKALTGDETIMEQALEAASSAVAALGYAGEKLDVIASSGHKSVKASAATTSLRAQISELGKKTDLIQVLLGNSVPVNMQSLATEDQVRQLMEQLLQQERYGLAAYVGNRWSLPVRHVWEHWARSLILLGRYEDAETRLRQALKQADDDSNGPSAMEITLSFVRALEETAPVNLDGLQSLCCALTAAALQEAEDPLSVNEYLKVLKGPQKLPMPQVAAYRSIPEAKMVGRRYALAERLLREHAPGSLLAFLFRHGRAAAACELLFPPADGPAGSNGSDCAMHSRYTIEDLLELACQHGELRTLQRTLAAGGERGLTALMEICNWLSQPRDQMSDKQQGSAVDALPVQDRLQFVQRCHLATHRHDLAGQACVQLACLAPDFASAQRQLANAVLHFESASRRAVRGAPSRAEIMQHIMLAQLQSAVYEEVASQAASEQLSVFGLRWPGLNPTVGRELTPGQFALYENVPGSVLPTAQERRLAVALRLLPRRPDLGFRALHAFCPGTAPRVFAAAAAALARGRATVELRALLQGIQGTVASDEWDQVLAAAVDSLGTAGDGVGSGGVITWGGAWAGGEEYSSPAKELILSMHSTHAQVEAFLRLSCFEEAFRIARNSGSAADVRRVMAEAGRRSDADVVAMCTEYLQGL